MSTQQTPPGVAGSSLAAAGASAAAAAGGMRRIATEEAWSIPEHMEALAALSRSTWDNLDVATRRGAEGGSPLASRLTDTDDERLAQMDADGVSMHVLSLTSPGVQVFEPETAVALAALANDRLAEVVRRHPTRFAGLASFAPQDPARAAKEMERAIDKLGLHGFVVNSHTNDEYLDDPKYWPILEAAEALEAPIYIHPRSPADSMARPFRSHRMQAAVWGYAIETGTHAMRLILSGVFDRFPKLKIVLGHMGENIPYHLWRSDYWYERRRSEYVGRMKPSEVFKRNFLITTSGVEHAPVLEYCLKVLGADNIMWAIDYPYQPSTPAVRFMNEVAISEEDRRKIFHLNAERVFRIGRASA